MNAEQRRGRLRRRERPVFLPVLAAGLLILGAAGLSAGPQQEKNPAKPQQRSSGASGRQNEASAWKRASEEGYWYSLYNLSSLVMGRSGMGIRFTPPPERIRKFLDFAGLAGPPLKHPYFVLIPYSSGDPHFTTRWSPDDGATWRWDASGFDKAVTAEGWAWTAVKEFEWAKHFEDLKDVLGSPLNHFRALMLNSLGTAGTIWMMEHMRLDNGLFAHAWKDGRIIDATPRLEDQWVVLLELSSLASVASGRFDWYQWYEAPLPIADIHRMQRELATAITQTGIASRPSFSQAALGIQALAWFASASPPSRPCTWRTSCCGTVTGEADRRRVLPPTGCLSQRREAEARPQASSTSTDRPRREDSRRASMSRMALRVCSGSTGSRPPSCRARASSA